MVDYKITEEFTDTPGGRYRKLGKFSGEEFRDDILLPLLEKHEKITIWLEDAEGYPSSFLEESFGGLVRYGLSNTNLKRRLSLRSSDKAFEFYIEEIWNYIDQAASQSNGA